MSQEFPPNTPRNNIQFIDLRTGYLSAAGHELLQQYWRQVAAGFTVTPCTATGTNAVILTPTLHQEGGTGLTDYMGFAFELPATLSDVMTITLASHPVRKAYTSLGRAQATTGDGEAGDFFIAWFVQSLDSGAGGFCLK